MMWTSDRDPFREVLMVGSVWWFPSTKSGMIIWKSSYGIGSEIERMVRLIQKWLKAGVMEDGQWFETKEGTPQGAVISPLLANLYLHYVLDLWVEAWRKKVARGEVIIVRYADDAVLGFQHREDAEKFLEELRERLAKFGLELHPEKTRLIEFGRYAAERAEEDEGKGNRKPLTFWVSLTSVGEPPDGHIQVYRKTIGKRMAAKLKEIRAEAAQTDARVTGNTVEWLQRWFGDISNITPYRAMSND